MLDQIQADCNFLKKIGVMDYSLLLGVHERDTSAPPSQQRPVPVLLTAQADAGVSSTPQVLPMHALGEAPFSSMTTLPCPSIRP